MIDFRTALETAIQCLVQLSIDHETIEPEEVEISDDRRLWFVTLTYNIPLQPADDIKRNTRIFKIDAETGEILGMKSR